MKIRRNKLIKAILDFTIKDMRLIKELKSLDNKTLLFHLENYCLICNVSYIEQLERFKVINKKG
jgi:hypothetical protein